MIQIIDNQGTVIDTLVDSYLAPGKYDVSCDMEMVPSGIYYVRLQNEQIQQVKSMMKVKG